jgi:hypothetical protein
MYCLATGIPRTEEHLIPRALGGRATLRDAVCEPCRRVTGRLEQATLDREFLVPKTLLALKRRRARGKGPGRLPPIQLVGDDAPSDLTPESFPRSFSLAAFEPAGLLADAARGDTPPRIDFVDCRLNLGTPTRQTVAASRPLADSHAYAWAIAKWGYALAVAERGLDCCDTQPMRDLMLGRRADAFAFVGTPAPRAPASRDWLHDHAVHQAGPWLTVRLALFASAGMLPYEVVIGSVATVTEAMQGVPRAGLEPARPSRISGF